MSSRFPPTPGEWVVSSMMFGAAVGAVGSGWLSFKLGRKKSLMIGAILFVAGSLFSAAAPNVEILLGSRVLLGGGGRRLIYGSAVSV